MGTRELLSHQYGQTWLTILNNENITHKIKEALSERARNGFLSAMDLMEMVLG